MAAPKREQFSHFLSMPVRWGDMDALGHVNNAKYFTYDESVRLQYFEALIDNDPRFWVDYGFILAHIEADFLNQLKPPADMDIGFRVTRLGGSSLRSESCIFVGDQAIAVVRGVIVWFDYANQRSHPIPAHVRELIRQRERLSPEEA